MEHLKRFQTYADAFEQTYVDDDWDRLKQYFAADAVYAPGDGTEAVGCDQVIAQLRNGVNGLDRRFDSRELSATTPTLEGDTVALSWRLTLRKAGTPDLTATGVEYVTFTDGVISRMEDVFDKGVAESLGNWMAAHGDSLEA